MVVVESLRKTRLYMLLIGLEVMERDERQWKRANQCRDGARNSVIIKTLPKKLRGSGRFKKRGRSDSGTGTRSQQVSAF